MKKICNRISRPQWRVTVPNLNSALFRRSTSSTEENPDASVSEPPAAQDSPEHSSSMDTHTHKCVLVLKGESDDSDRDSRYEDASPMYEERLEVPIATPERDFDTNVYADVEYKLSAPDETKEFDYDIPKISFSFFDEKTLPSEEYEVPGSKPRCATPKLKKSQLRIILATPSAGNSDTEEETVAQGSNSNLNTALEATVEDSSGAAAAAAATAAVELDKGEVNAEIVNKYEFDTTHVDNQINKMSGSCDDVSLAENKYVIAAPKLLEIGLDEFNMDKITLISWSKFGSDPSVELRHEESGEGSFKVPPRDFKRMSRSLHDLKTICGKKRLHCDSARSQIIHHVVLAHDDKENVPEENSIKFEYCHTRNKLPLKIRRPTLLRKPQVRLRAPEKWTNFRSKVSNIIATHSAAQRVGATSQTDRLINLDQLYKSSRNKCKRFVARSGRFFVKKRSGSDAGTVVNCDVSEDGSSHIVKNDAFFDHVRTKSDDALERLSDMCESRTTLAGPREDEKSEFDFTSLRSAFRKSRIILEGQNGFDDLRKFVKQGGDFCKELSAILHERSEAELQYAKSLSKLSSKLSRACRDGVGGLNEAWKSVACDMDSRAEAHRQFSSALCEEIVRPLRQVTEAQHKRRKAAEGCTDKAARGLAEWRAAEAKSKKQSHQCARDNEKLQDALLDVRLSRSTSLIQLAHMHNHKALSDKESAKLEGKKRKAEDAVKKADIEYYTLCVRAERARLEWESAVLRGTKTFQSLEEERLNNLKSILTAYLNHSSEMCPRLLESTEKLRKPIMESEPSKDMSAFVNLKNSSQHVSEQLLPDFYCEHITLAMNRERRKQALVKLLHLIRQDLERERKSKNGLENLSRAMKQTPNFGAEDSQQNVSEKLYHMRSMLTYLEGARYKVQSAVAEMENRQRISHPLAAHITITRDKSGLQQSILKVPQWLREEFVENDKHAQREICEGEVPDWTDRGMADGNSNQHDSDFDEFSSQGSSVAEECHNVPLGQCKALYAYTANLPDELNLQPGDLLSVYRKQEDGWWLGECNGCVGIFPATYVENV